MWIFYWIAHYLTKEIRAAKGINTHTIIRADTRGLRNQILHYVDRYSYLGGHYQYLHPSNKVFLNWFHGDSSDPDMQPLFSTLSKTAGRLEKIVVSCEISKKTLIEFGIPPDKLVLIPLGIDLSLFKAHSDQIRHENRLSLGIPENSFCIGSFQKDGVGWDEGLQPKLIKGPDIFLEVVANLFSNHKNLFVLLTGPARGYVKNGLEKLGVPYVHHFLNNYHELTSYYQCLDLYIIPSRCEGGPMSLFECWAAGVPLVSTKVGMPADLIAHGKNGFIAEVEDVRALTEHAITLIENKSLRDSFIKQGLEDVKNFDWPLIAERYYQELYLPILQRRNG